MKRRRWIAAPAMLPVVSLAALSLGSCSVPELGLRDGRLLPCPSSPNCVSSLATGEQRVAPFPVRTEPAAAMAELIDAVEGGHDHDAEPVVHVGRYTGLEIDMSSFGRNREINPNSSFSVVSIGANSWFAEEKIPRRRRLSWMSA